MKGAWTFVYSLRSHLIGIGIDYRLAERAVDYRHQSLGLIVESIRECCLVRMICWIRWIWIGVGLRSYLQRV